MEKEQKRQKGIPLKTQTTRQNTSYIVKTQRKKLLPKNIFLVKLNNKSRKGTYIKILYGKKYRTYKYTPEIPIDEYNKRAKQSISLTKKAPRSKPKKTNWKPPIIKVGGFSGKTKIENILQKGQNTIQLPLNKIKNNIPGAHRKLLQGLVKDKDLLKILTQPSNRQKYKNRLWYTITINGYELDLNDQTNQDLLNIQIGNKTTEEIINLVEQNFPQNSTINGQEAKKILKNLGIENSSQLLMDTNNSGETEYLITNIMLKIEYRKD